MSKLINIFQTYSLIICVAFLSILFVMFYPTRPVAVDEQEYLHNAQLLVDGSLQQNCDTNNAAHYPVYAGYQRGNGQPIASQSTLEDALKLGEPDYCISKYNLGTSFFLVPFVAIQQPQLAFVAAFLMFLLGIWLFSQILKLLNLSPLLVYLYALFPAFIYYSRTLYSETFSATLILLVLYTLIKSDKGSMWWGLGAGLSAGLAVWVRYTNVIPLILMIAAWLLIVDKLQVKLMLKRAAPILIGAALPLLLLLAFNTWLYGSPLRSGYYFSGEEGIFNIGQMPLFLVRFVIVLSLIYPVMYLSGFWLKHKLKWVLLLPVLATTVFYSAFPSTFFESRLLDLIFGIRFLLPIVPLLLVAYCLWLQQSFKWQTKPYFKILVSAIVILLLSAALLLSALHQQFLQSML